LALDPSPTLRPALPAHLPSGLFSANTAWLVCAAMAFNLTRATGTLASTFHAKATTATIRDQLINVPARLARTARRLVLHLPRHWPWEAGWQQLHSTVTATGPPARA
jgi:Transposase DDE domain group 1